jgi:hypothetical protein
VGTAAHIGIDWSTASVDDGTLAVEIVGELPKGWAGHFRGVVSLLDRGGRWGPIALRKGAIRVTDVEPGAEEDLRHMLESAVVQTDADLDVKPDGDPGEQDPQAELDREMTRRFRGFAADTR